MKSKQEQLNNQVGLYMRLSQEDEREGESVSIENQKMILEKYAQERGCEIVDEYIDDGWSGTNFDRPDVQRLLEDAKIGRINTIIVKDLSRFGRNYIQVGELFGKHKQENPRRVCRQSKGGAIQSYLYPLRLSERGGRHSS